MIIIDIIYDNIIEVDINEVIKINKLNLVVVNVVSNLELNYLGHLNFFKGLADYVICDVEQNDLLGRREQVVELGIVVIKVVSIVKPNVVAINFSNDVKVVSVSSDVGWGSMSPVVIIVGEIKKSN